MRKRVLLFAALAMLFSCNTGRTVRFGDWEPPGRSDFGEFILQEYRDRFLALYDSRHHYHLKLDMDRRNKKVLGTARIAWHNGSGEELRELEFRLLVNNRENRPMAVTKVESGGRDLTWSLSEDYSTLTIPLEEAIGPDGDRTVTLTYELDYNTPPDNYFDFDRIDDRGFSMAHFYPVAVPFSKGIWEDTELQTGGDLLNADSAWFYVEIETDSKVTVAASGRELRRESGSGRQKISYCAGPVRDFYLSGSADSVVAENSSAQTRIFSYSPASMKARSGDAAVITSRALSLFSREFGDYPFAELKIAALPMRALGIEFPALFAIGENIYGDASERLFAPTVVHEAAHQWFYSLVGNDQLTDPWIDESFAQYATWYYFNETYGLRGSEGFYQSFLDRWKRIENNPVPIGESVSFYSPVEYGAVIYGRAPLFLLDVRELMGEEKFHAFLKEIIGEFSNRRIDTETYLAEMREAAGPGLEPLIGEYF